MDDPDSESRRMDVRGANRLTDRILGTWSDAGLDSDGRWSWPAAEAQFSVDVDESSDAGLDVLAAVLDTTPREPATVAVHVEHGRRNDLQGDRRDALERLAANPEVTALADDTAGAAPATDETVEAVFRLYGPDLRRATVLDEDGLAIVEYLDGRVEFSLPAARIDEVRSALPDGVGGRLTRRS
jgi:hypothetical protein